ncbi:MAG: Pyrethroid hydrolase [Legionellaceae bacterium]
MNSRTYLLLHGAWHSNWCWEKIIPLLEKEKHKVIAPNLPGHGDDKTVISNISLDTYIAKISAFIADEQEPIILVGHSMAGIVITEIAENKPEKMAQLIYISAFIPDNNCALILEEKKAQKPSISQEIIIDPIHNEIRLKLSRHLKKIFYNQCSKKDYQSALSRLQKQPLQPFLDTVHYSSEKFGSVKKLYIECLNDNAIRIEDQRRMHAKNNSKTITLNSDHSPFLSMPQKLAKALLL